MVRRKKHNQEVLAFPTEQRNRQKARKQAGHAAKKKKHIDEDHHDDCGEDFGPLGDDYLAQSYFDIPDLSDNSDEET